jgi:hypothetical protein
MTHSICLIIQTRAENYFFSGSLAVSLPDAGFFSEMHVVRTKVDIYDYITLLKNSGHGIADKLLETTLTNSGRFGPIQLV